MVHHAFEGTRAHCTLNSLSSDEMFTNLKNTLSGLKIFVANVVFYPRSKITAGNINAKDGQRWASQFSLVYCCFSTGLHHLLGTQRWQVFKQGCEMLHGPLNTGTVGDFTGVCKILCPPRLTSSHVVVKFKKSLPPLCKAFSFRFDEIPIMLFLLKILKLCNVFENMNLKNFNNII